MVRIRSGVCRGHGYLPDHLLCCLWILGRQGKQQSENEVTGGRQLTDNPKDVARMLKRRQGLRYPDWRPADYPGFRNPELLSARHGRGR